MRIYINLTKHDCFDVFKSKCILAYEYAFSEVEIRSRDVEGGIEWFNDDIPMMMSYFNGRYMRFRTDN